MKIPIILELATGFHSFPLFNVSADSNIYGVIIKPVSCQVIEVLNTVSIGDFNNKIYDKSEVI